MATASATAVTWAIEAESARVFVAAAAAAGNAPPVPPQLNPTDHSENTSATAKSAAKSESEIEVLSKNRRSVRRVALGAAWRDPAAAIPAVLLTRTRRMRRRKTRTQTTRQRHRHWRRVRAPRADAWWRPPDDDWQ